MTEANTQNESSRSPSTPAEDKPVAAQPLPQWPAWWPSGLPQTDGRGTLKQAVEDFLVDELPLAMPCGEGEHVWMWVEKTGANTAFVAAEIARFAGVRDLDVGFAGLKDETERANLIAWMYEQADAPLALPEPSAEDLAAVEAHNAEAAAAE